MTLQYFITNIAWNFRQVCCSYLLFLKEWVVNTVPETQVIWYLYLLFEAVKVSKASKLSSHQSFLANRMVHISWRLGEFDLTRGKLKFMTGSLIIDDLRCLQFARSYMVKLFSKVYVAVSKVFILLSRRYCSPVNPKEENIKRRSLIFNYYSPAMSDKGKRFRTNLFRSNCNRNIRTFVQWKCNVCRRSNSD